MKNLIAMMMFVMVLATSCDNNKQYEENIAEYKYSSIRLMAACASQLYNIHTEDESEYALQEEKIDSINQLLGKTYEALTPPTDKYKDCYPYIKNAHKHLGRMTSLLGVMKVSNDNHDESMRLLDEFNNELNEFKEAIEEVELQTPSIKKQ